MKIAAIIQARTGSTRFPQKIFCELAGKPLLWHVINRIKKSQLLTNIIIATTNNKKDDIIDEWAKKESVEIFRGDEQNVLSRYYAAAKQNEVDVIVRVTADDPFKDPEIMDNVITAFLQKKVDFAYNNNPASFPEGLDVEVFSMEALEKAFFSSSDEYEQEHVTQYFFRNLNQFKSYNLSNDTNLSFLRWTIDTIDDYKMTQTVYETLYKPGQIFLMSDILKLLESKPEIALLNNNVPRSAMYLLNDQHKKNK